MSLTLDDFDYPLPPELIAQTPLAERSSSRLLQVSGDGLVDRKFVELPQLLQRGDLLVFNDTRVIPARLIGRRQSGGRCEAMIERILDERDAWAQVRASHRPRAGTRLFFAAGALEAEVLQDKDGLLRLRFAGSKPLAELLQEYGAIPLPPYIERAPDAEDAARYQTVYASEPGAVAAPTAGLHFDTALLQRLASCGIASARVTLHVGAGTFQPVRVQRIAEHHMHAERLLVPAATVAACEETRRRGGRVVAVGTTTLRALEAAAQGGRLQALEGETALFITPGFQFQVVDRLLSNFHLPRSTLLMLVSAFAGTARIREAYAHAVAARYRFFSYGDAMLLECAESAGRRTWR